MPDRANQTIRLTLSVLIISVFLTAAGAKTIYVDADATGANNGTSWADAYTFLQEALADANQAEKPVEVRVAQGTYRPNEGLVAIPEFDWRTVTFQLINGVTIKGGFAGVSEVDPDIRDVEIYETILSGDLTDDDFDTNEPVVLPYESTRADNSYHVVTGSGTDGTAVLDGVTISCGNARYPSPENGGGMSNIDGSPTISNCTFIRNWAWNGGGMYNSNSSPTLTNCTFSLNSGFYGGGMYCRYSHPKLTNCLFTRNSTTAPPGVIFARPHPDKGGGMYNYYSNPILANCTISGNSSRYGGGIYNYDSHLILTNCTLAGNSAYEGLPMYNYGSSLSMSNSTLWNGGNDIHSYASATITYSNVQGGWPGNGNIDVDPLFANPGYWADVNDPNIVIEPDDLEAVWKAVWVDGDYHLKSHGGRWDPASESWIVDDVTSLCIDAGDPNISVGAEPEPNGGRINMGAYGGTKEASKSPVAQTIVYIQWLGHSSVRLWTENCIVYVDPQNLSISPHDATLVCVTHTHGDHYSRSDIAKVSSAQTQFVAPPDVVQRYGSGRTIAPGQTIEFDVVRVAAVPAYNTNKPNHPKSRNWVGYIIELGGKRIYVAGDTDLIDEMKSLGDVDVAILPAGGTYTMNAVEAAEATQYIKPDLAIPYHWGRNVGTLNDAQRFAELAHCPVKILAVGETIGSEN
ncbi:MAG: MBL fold metallo-hydrolase [Phycisphaerales bacterium]|nr:MAG: MBL fold metallo-hydrolase [Phycisphaerales bacterium]